MAKENDPGGRPPPGGPPRPRSYDWLAQGGQTWDELAEEVESEAAPDPNSLPEGVVAKLTNAGVRWLPDGPNAPPSAPASDADKPPGAGGPQSVIAGMTRLLPDSEPDAASGGASGVVVGGTAILGDAHPRPSTPTPPSARPVEPAGMAGGTAHFSLSGNASLSGEIRRPPPPPPPRKSAEPTPAPRPPIAAAPPAPAPRAPQPAAPEAQPAPPSDSAWPPGSRIGQYEIIRQLGAGGMGVVFLARDDKLGRRVAIKFLQTGNADLTRRFLVEARATAQCSHENIVVIHEVGEVHASPYMVLEYLQGQTLTQVIKKSAPLSPTRAVELAVSVVRALACAHEQGIVHRDLKPENILLTDSGTVKVLDFGIAKVLRDDARGPMSPQEIAANAGGADLRQAARSGIIGTMAYMSPEQWGLGDVDVRTDIWATGVVLYTMLTGVHPLEQFEPDPYGFVMQLDKPMPSIREALPSLPAELARVVDGCLKKKHAERLPDAAALLRALEPFLPGRYNARSVQQIETGPYAGLSSFQEEDAGRFFGRNNDIAALVTRIQDFPLMAAVGPSGVGKSSFIRAGVVPALKGSGEKWESLVTRPGRDPVFALASMLAPLVGSSTTAGDDLGAQKDLAAKLAAEPGHFGSALRTAARRTGQRLLLFIDQFEELYTLGADAAARRAFTACLAAAADDATSPVRVILSIRSDFLGRVAEDSHFMNEVTKGLFILGPPSAEGLRDAIVQPAEMAGYRFESPAMIDEMMQYLEAEPGALPLLQFTAAQLWEARDPRRKLLTKQSYDALGGIAGALVSHADRVIAKLTPEAQTLARWLFPHLVTPERTRAVRDLGELTQIAASAADFDRVVQHLVDSRLLVVQTGTGGAAGTVEIVHESLIEGWPTLRRWLDESHEESVFLDQLWAAARQWEANKRARGLLWSGDIVDELARFKRRYKGELPPVVRAFSDAVSDQKARGARRRRRLLSGAVVALAGLLAAAAVALVIIGKARKDAEENAVAAKRAESEAQNRLAQVQAKERERQKAEALQKVAEGKAKEAAAEVKMTNEELEKANDELKGALATAREQKENAQEAKTRAEANEWAAKEAKNDAQKSAAELAKLLQKERERADRLNAQLGTLVEMLR